MRKIDLLNTELNILLANFTTYIATEKQLASNTISSYRQDIKCFFDWLKSHIKSAPNINSLKIININDLRAWLAFRLQNNITHRSNARAIASLKSFFEFLNDNNIVENKAIFNLKKPRLPKLLPKAIDCSEVKNFLALLENSANQQWQNARDIALFMLIFTSGMRISEALSMQKKDINNNAFYVKGKGGKTRIIPILPITKDKILAYLKLCPFVIMDTDPLFVSNLNKPYYARAAQLTMQNIRQAFGLKNITPHTLRHSCATSLLESSDELQKIQRLLGHASLSTTQIYTKITKQKILESILEE